MNNKSDKKHKRKQKQKKPKTKKKTSSRQSKKKIEIKTGGVWSFSKDLYNSKRKIPSNQQKWNNPTTLAELQQPLLPKSNRLANEPRANSNTLPQNASQASASANPNNSQQIVSQTQPPANPNNSQQIVSQTQPPTNPKNSQQNVLPVKSNNSQPPPPPPLPPSAQPQGFNTLKAQSRCSIM